MTSTVRTQSGAPLGGFFEKYDSPVTSPPNRWSDTGRSPFAARKAEETAMKYSTSSSFVMLASGHITRDGLETRIVRVPCGPSTSTVVASLAMPGA